MATRDTTYEYAPTWWGSWRTREDDSSAYAINNAENFIVTGFQSNTLWTGLVGFDWSQIRRDIGGKTLLKAYISTRVGSFANPSNSGTLQLGFHRYLSKPGRIYPAPLPWGGGNSMQGPGDAGEWPNWPVGSDLRADITGANGIVGFSNGTYGGILYGPGRKIFGTDAQNDTLFNAQILVKFCRLSFVVREEVTNPNPPTLNNAEYGKVLDPTGPITFDFTHSDPNGYPMSGFYFRRTRDSVQQWWNGTDWQSTEVMLSPAQAPVTSGVVRRLTIPGGKWGARPASSPYDYWAIATASTPPNATSGTKSNYTSLVQFFPSTPPSVTIQQPSSLAYRNTRPIIRWSFFDSESNPQFGWIAQIVPPSAYQKAGYNPDNYTGQLWSYSGDSATQRSVQADVNLENHGTYRVYMKVVSSPNPQVALQYSPWVYNEFTVSVEPPPPTIRFPRTGSSADLQAGFTLTWENIFSSEGGSQQQAAFAIRRNRPAGAYEWWNGTAWTASEFYASGGNASYSFRPSEVVNGISWTFAVSIRDGYGLVSGYSTGVTVLGSSAPQVTLVSPPATVTSVTPTISWTMYDLENDPQQTYRARVIDYALTQSGTIDPATVASIWDSTEVADQYSRSIKLPIELVNGSKYRVYLRLLAGGVYSEWVYADFTVSLIPPALPSATTRLLEDTGAVEVTIQGRDSMLTAEASRCVGDWEVLSGATLQLGIGENTSLSGYKGIATASAANVTMRMRTMSSFPVVSDFQYTIGCTFLTDVNAGYVESRTGLEFFDNNGQSLGISWAVGTSDQVPNRNYVTLRSPGTAFLAKMIVEFRNVVDKNDKHFFFDPVVRPTTGAEWSPGGMLGITSVSIVEKTDFRIVRQGLNIKMPVDSQRVLVLDEEIPIGRAMTYELTMRALYPSDVLVTKPVVLPGITWTSGWLWLSDPLRPGTAKCFGPKEFGSIEKPARQGKFRPIGRADAVITRGIRGLEEGSFTIITHSRAERQAYYDIIDKSEIILLRVPPDRGEDEGETFYVRMEGDLPTKRVMQHRTPHREIEQSWTRQSRPLDGLVFGEDY